MAFRTFDRNTWTINSLIISFYTLALFSNSFFEGSARWIASSPIVSFIFSRTLTFSIQPDFIETCTSLYTGLFFFTVDFIVSANAFSSNHSKSKFTIALLFRMKVDTMGWAGSANSIDPYVWRFTITDDSDQILKLCTNGNTLVQRGRPSFTIYTVTSSK